MTTTQWAQARKSREPRMNHKDCALLQRLIVELDDARRFYANLSNMMVHPHLKCLLERVLRSHGAIAEDLTEHVRTMGMQMYRGGSALGRLRARYIAWLTATRIDLELACMREIEHREALIVQRFVTVSDRVPGLKQHLYHYLRELEGDHAQIEWAICEIAMPALTVARNPIVAPAHSIHDRSRR